MYIAYTSRYIASTPKYLTGRKYFPHTCRKASSLFYIGRKFVERSSLHLEHGRVMCWLLPLSQSGLILSRSRYFIHYTGHCGSRAPPAGIYQPVGLSPCPSSSVYSRRWDRMGRYRIKCGLMRTSLACWMITQFTPGVLFNVSIVACPLTVKLNGVESYYIVEVPVSLRSESWSQIDSAGYTNECR